MCSVLRCNLFCVSCIVLILLVGCLSDCYLGCMYLCLLLFGVCYFVVCCLAMGLVFAWGCCLLIFLVVACLIAVCARVGGYFVIVICLFLVYLLI